MDPFDVTAFCSTDPFAKSSTTSPRLVLDEFADPFFPDTTTTRTTTTKAPFGSETSTGALTAWTTSASSLVDENANPRYFDKHDKMVDSSSSGAAVKKNKQSSSGTSVSSSRGEEKKEDHDPASDEVSASTVCSGPPAPSAPTPPPPSMQTMSTTVVTANKSRRLPNKSPRAFMAASPPTSLTKQPVQQQHF